ncbi:VWA domain-containing protein [Telmatobacter bradus]|uniref:VWA domain-containing protein n=1 Tax=Telmatobacter bradus TaxID=474953 RepID=UPI003B4379FD
MKLVALSFLSSSFLYAQQLPPAEAPLPMPHAHADAPTLHMNTTEVLVPTLVEKKDGDVVYGLRANDFVVEDNGVAQKIRVQEEMDTAPVSLVVAFENGGASELEFDKLAKLGPLLDLFLSDHRSQVALMGFDSDQQLIQDFTGDSEKVNEALKQLQPGDGGAAILDTVSAAVDLLKTQPKEYRRVLLLISEERDHGSKHIKPAELVQKIGGSEVLVLSVSFSPMWAELAHDVKDSGDDRTTGMLPALLAIVQGFRKNIAKEVAQMSGGEYLTFTGDKRFQEQVMRAARHARNRYLITFSPSDPTPGLHTLRVRTAENYGAKVVARANYWLEEQ